MANLGVSTGMRRRDFICALGVVAAPCLSQPAQASARAVIGYLHPLAGPLQRDLSAFRDGLKAAGYAEPDNVRIEFRNAQGQNDRLAALAAELSRQRVSVIFTSGGVAGARAAKAATSTIPIVFVHGSDPVQAGLVQTLARPGGNVTGVTFLTGEMQPKTFELLRAALPAATSIAVLVNPRSATGESRQVDVVRAAQVFGIDIQVVHAATPDEFDAAFAAIRRQGNQAVLVVADPVFRNRQEALIALADRFSIPLIGFGREFAAAGALMSYGADPVASFREAGVYVGRILKGEKPADLPVLQPTRFELVINLKTAKARGVEISSLLIALADEVFE
jgi:putative ABC transport system substrate-binding protein